MTLICVLVFGSYGSPNLAENLLVGQSVSQSVSEPVRQRRPATIKETQAVRGRRATTT